MDERDYQLNPDNGRDPWDRDSYETGSTRPPKSNRGLLALFLVAGILIGGVMTALGGMNIHLVQQWMEREREQDSLPLSLSTNETDTAAAAESVTVTEAYVETKPVGEAEVELHTSPAGLEVPVQKDGLSMQAIYDKCIGSTVSIICSSPAGRSSGSGVVLSEDGYVITNYHVVEGASALQVLLTDGRYLQASMIGGDKLSDLAVLQIAAENLIPAEFGDSDTLRVGDTVVAIGDPLGVELRGTMTDGIVSAINRDITTEGRTLTLIQTNAALNSGNSGGPLINCYGQVIGINTMKIGDYVNSAGVEGLGFAIPSTTVKQIVDQLIAQGYVSGRPDLGISGTALSSFYQYYYRLPAGVYINEVDEGSDAQLKGILPKDILLSVGGQRVTSMEDVQTVLYAHEAGETVEVIIYRNGQQYRVDLTLAESTS